LCTLIIKNRAETVTIMETNIVNLDSLQNVFGATIPNFVQQMQNIQAKRDATLQSITHLTVSTAQNLDNAIKKLSVRISLRL
jgi:hypothetical protein